MPVTLERVGHQKKPKSEARIPAGLFFSDLLLAYTMDSIALVGAGSFAV
jgi:hypothetical protein